MCRKSDGAPFSFVYQISPYKEITYILAMDTEELKNIHEKISMYVNEPHTGIQPL